MTTAFVLSGGGSLSAMAASACLTAFAGGGRQAGAARSTVS
jgi:hypothetical protein